MTPREAAWAGAAWGVIIALVLAAAYLLGRAHWPM
jgi:hypothetical protein